MVSTEDFGQFETAWCPGCGNFAILKTIKQALAEKDIAPQQALFVSGIGQAAKSPHYMRCNLFNGLHGRALPVATGAKLANPELTVIAQSGDGCNYGEGGNHFLAAIRRNVNITLLAHDNQIYGLTKGQASPTTETGHVTKAQPQGAPSASFKPLAIAVAMQAGFVARGFCGMPDHLTSIIQSAIDHPGFALVDILQNCVSFNQVNTFAWYKERCTELDASYDPTDWETAMRTSLEWGERIPVGVIYTNRERPPFQTRLPLGEDTVLARQQRENSAVAEAMQAFA